MGKRTYEWSLRSNVATVGAAIWVLRKVGKVAEVTAGICNRSAEILTLAQIGAKIAQDLGYENMMQLNRPENFEAFQALITKEVEKHMGEPSIIPDELKN